jgi:Glyoxalase/Bleomycin resistance protein/Dioxygenase superfamily
VITGVDVLGLPSVDAGGGWPIFALPPAELAAHPAEQSGTHELYLMCDDITATVEELKAKGVEFATPVTEQGFGLMTRLKLPGGVEVLVPLSVRLRDAGKPPVRQADPMHGVDPPVERRRLLEARRAASWSERATAMPPRPRMQLA